MLPGPAHWISAAAIAVILALLALVAWRGEERRTYLLIACLSCGLLFVAGVALIWARSEMVGTPGIPRAVSMPLEGGILDRIEQPAEGRTRLVLAVRDGESGRAMRVRVNVPLAADRPEFTEGAVIRLRARLMPPAPPMLPGGYDFARAAWFTGLAATGSAQGQPVLVRPAERGKFLPSVKRQLADHVRQSIPGTAGSIAAALASGDRGAIPPDDEEAMRNSGLTHLLSISGLHVSAVVTAAYLLAIKLLALWPWLALRVRLPLTAAAFAAGTGIAYTLLTGAEVPTVRSCAAALLVLGAVTLGREALSLRMVAVAAIFVLLLWPESIAGPSFQMSFAAVIAIIALHETEAVRAFLAPREESWPARLGRRGMMLIGTGLVIELALMPIVLFHFHRAGLYGAFANVIAIPLVTLLSMPLIGLALAFDTIGLAAPFWWLAGKSLEALLAIARFTAGQPGATKLMPQMSHLAFSLFVIGGLWLGLWRGRVRLWGAMPAVIATGLLLTTSAPDVLISGDGHNAGITTGTGKLVMLRDSRSDYTRENFLELAGIEADPLPAGQWQGANCSPDFCVATLERHNRTWRIVMTRSREMVSERELAATCALADIVISDRRLPASCAPTWLKADRRMLEQSGGIALYLDAPRMQSVAEGQGQHGWWRPAVQRVATDFHQ